MNTPSPKTIVIVGGVAGGASGATRLRRMDDSAEIIVLERGPYASFANCGLPYHIGGVIEKEDDLLVAKGPLFKDRFAVDLRTQHEAVATDREAREVEVRDLASGRNYCQRSPQLADFDLLDVRDPDEFAAGHAPGARNLPLNVLRSMLSGFSKKRPLALYCAVGARAHNAVRLLRQHGFYAANLPGCFTTLLHVAAAALK